MTVRIILADDHPVFRAGLRALLDPEPDLEVVGEAVDGEGALRLAEELAPEVVVLDISMPGMDGMETLQRIIARQPGIRVLLLTALEEVSMLRAAVQAGAAGYVVKRVAETELLWAVRSVAQGEIYVHSGMSANLAPPAPPPVPDDIPVERLTPRETEVLRLIARGYTNPEMALELHLSVRTVESHRARLMDKLDMHSRVDLVRYAHRQGLLEPGEA